jgi:hypothetical protein
MPTGLDFLLRIALASHGLCVSICISQLFFYFCAECNWNFDRDCVEHVDCFWWYGHFHNVDSTDS